MNALLLPILSLVIILNFIIAVIILSRGIRDKVNLLFGLISLGVSLWSFGILGFYLIEISFPHWWIIETHSSAALIALIFVLFTFNFPTLLIKKIYIRNLPLLPFFLTLYYLFFTNEIIGGVNGLSYEIGKGYLFYAMYIIFCFLIGYYALFLQYKRATDKIQKIQVSYVLTGAIFSSVLATISDLVLPYFNIFEYTWLGPVFTFLLVGTIAYAILKHHLFNIKVIATELFTFAVWIVLLIKLFFSRDIQEIFINISLLGAAIFFGVLVIRGVLNEIKYREQMEKMAREVAQAYEVERKAREELEKLDKYKDNYLMQVQHDLRSPFSVLMGYTDLLLENAYGRIPKEAREVLKKMQDVLTDKVRDINNFLDVKQFKLGKGVVSIKPGVNLVSLIEKIVETLFPKTNTSDKKIYLKFEKEGDNFIISADEEKLKSAIFNIVDNGIKYTKEGGVTIRLKRLEDRIRIEIQDTGIGISEEKKKTIFEAPFERTLEAQKMAGGSGVGLYLSSEIIKAHNGKIWAESKGEGLGSTFFIELPVS